jgi:hypothetical protein
MDNRDMHQLEKLYVRETQQYLRQLREGASHLQLADQKARVVELSQMLDRKGRNTDPSANLLRRHP